MQKLIIFGGATASGKTAKSIEIAKEVNGEIVCGDSMQIYRHMKIGTAAPTEDEKQGIPHHLFNCISPLINFSVAEYVKLASLTISEIASRGKTPILVGGTGLYLDSIAYNRQFSEMEPNPEKQAELNSMNNSELYRLLKEIDAQSANSINVANRRRLLRALEIYYATGKTKSELDASSHNERIYETTYYAIDMPRDVLYRRINKRVSVMLKNGLIQEVEELRRLGVTREKTAAQAIGYKELFAYFDGELSLDIAIETIKQASRRYAKRQLTWFKRNSEIIWLPSEENKN